MNEYPGLKLDYDKVLKRANELYKQVKLQSMPPDEAKHFAYTAPELLPDIRSEQVKAVLQALVEAINMDATTKA